MIEWFLTIAGILFGGGMLGQLIMFFVKRNDEIASKKKEIYKDLYNRLVRYESTLQNILLQFFKHTSSYLDKIKQKNNKINDYITEIETSSKRIKSFERKCKNKGCTDEMCVLCNSIRQRISELFSLIGIEQTACKNMSDMQIEYWKNNFESISNIISDNMNFRNIFLTVENKDKRIYSLVDKVDKQSFILFSTLLSAKGNEQTFQLAVISQMENIERCLIALSKKLNKLN